MAVELVKTNQVVNIDSHQTEITNKRTAIKPKMFLPQHRPIHILHSLSKTTMRQLHVHFPNPPQAPNNSNIKGNKLAKRRYKNLLIKTTKSNLPNPRPHSNAHKPALSLGQKNNKTVKTNNRFLSVTLKTSKIETKRTNLQVEIIPIKY